MVFKKEASPRSLLVYTTLMVLLTLCSSGFAAEFKADTVQKMPDGEFQGKFYVKNDTMRNDTNAHGQTQVTIIRQDLGVT
jgi:hypothetical protein